MLRYEKLPAKTPPKVQAAVVVAGIALGVAIFIEAFVALYGCVGLFSLYFYPSSNLLLSNKDVVILSLIALTAGVGTTALAFLAFYMNCLSKKAIRLSRWVWAPTLLSLIIVLYQRTNMDFSYHLSWRWVWLAYESIIFAGILPALLLHTRSGRKLFSR